MKNKLLVLLAVVLCAGLLSAGVFADENAAGYLKAYYGISFDGDVSAEEFDQALESLGAEPLGAEQLTLADVAVAAVRLAGMEEMVLAYAGKYETMPVDAEAAPYVAFAAGQGWVSKDDDFSGPVSAEKAASMLYKAAEIGGKARNYIGRLSDDDILTKLQNEISQILIFTPEDIVDTGIDILLDEAATGYSMKYRGYNANFLEENTLRYGHDSMANLLQLTALLKAEGSDAYVQVEPKTSVYEYLMDWGEPHQSLNYLVKEMTEGRYYAFAVEFELVLEFDTQEEKEAFHGLIETYAKKYSDFVDEDGVPTKPLLASSWWQPLYFSYTEMANEEFVALTDNVVSTKEGDFVIHTFTLPENANLIAASVANHYPDLVVSTQTVYVNPAFYRYVTDSDYQ